MKAMAGITSKGLMRPTPRKSRVITWGAVGSASGKGPGGLRAMRHGKWCDLVRRHRTMAENSIAAATGLPTAQVEVVRVRRWRHDLMEQRLSDLRLVNPDDVPACGTELAQWRPDLDAPRKKALILSDLAPQLQSLDRYLSLWEQCPLAAVKVLRFYFTIFPRERDRTPVVLASVLG